VSSLSSIGNRSRIVFDFGAVLFHWQPVQMLQRELPHLARNDDEARLLAEQVFQSYGGDWGDFDRGIVSVPELVLRISRRSGLSAADVQTVVDAVPRELQAMPASVALLRRLHALGHALYYLSNMPAPYADHLEAQNDFFALFTDGVFSGRVHHNKPEPAVFQIAAKRFGCAPSELLFMDDHGPNVEAARALGWQAFVFVDARQAEEELSRRGLLS